MRVTVTRVWALTYWQTQRWTLIDSDTISYLAIRTLLPVRM